MMKKLFARLLFLSIVSLSVMSCDEDDEGNSEMLSAGTLTGGPFTFVVDDTEDYVSGVEVTGTPVGTNSTFVITDDSDNILGLPGTVADLEGVNFNGAGAGVCFIWYLRYEDGLMGLEEGSNVADFAGEYSLSNSIEVTRGSVGTLSGGPFDFVSGDGQADMVSGIMVADNFDFDNTSYIVTDDENNILGLPGTLEMLEANDFDGAGGGVCYIWRITYVDGLTGLEVDANTDDLEGTFSLSSGIAVNRHSAGALSDGSEGTSFTFTVGDGMSDSIGEDGITISGNLDLDNVAWVVTDDSQNILALPESYTGPDFDGAGVGLCYIWRITYSDGLMGLMADSNIEDLDGEFSLSNSIEIRRTNAAGIIEGGPFTFSVGDGTADNIGEGEITVADNDDLTNTGWVVTDDENNILGLPDSFTGPDFDGAGTGVCLIWRITYEDDIMGLTTDGGSLDNLTGTYKLSNAIEVNRQ